jgi:vacuolar-type H+-ATPase subunit H
VTATLPAATASDVGTIDALKRIKATEAEWDAKIAAARQAAEAELKRLRDERDATVAAARAEAEAERARALTKARALAETEAEAIVAEGRSAAQAAATSAGKRPSERRDEILAVVLGSFASE